MNRDISKSHFELHVRLDFFQLCVVTHFRFKDLQEVPYLMSRVLDVEKIWLLNNAFLINALLLLRNRWTHFEVVHEVSAGDLHSSDLLLHQVLWRKQR